MTPGIGNTIAILVAGLWSSVDRNSIRSDVAGANGHLLSSLGLTMIAWLLVVAFYLTAWLPKQRSQQVEATVAARGGAIDESLAIAMLQADPWSPTGYRWIANVRLAQVDREATTNRLGMAPAIDRFRVSAEAYLASDRANWETWAQLGHWELAISPARKESLTRAMEYYCEACRRAPGEVGLLTQAALAAWLAEDIQKQQEYLSRAEAIETNVTHLDRKLAKAILYWPASVGPTSTRVAPAVWQSARESTDLQRDWVRAEPVFRFLRSQPSVK